MSDGTATAAPSAPATGAALARGPVLALLGAVGLVAVAALLVGGAIGGIFAAGLDFADPGLLVRFGLPVVGVVRDLSAAVTIGLLLLAATVIPESRTTRRRIVAARLAAVTASVWAVAGLTDVVLTFSDASGIPLASDRLGSELLATAWSLELLRVGVISACLAAVVAVGAALAHTRATLVWLAAGALLAVVPLALTGHAAGTAAHDTAVNGLAVHLLGASVWLGGLLGLLLLRPVLGPVLSVSVARYSTLAGWCFAAVALSGVASAWVRLGDLSGLGTSYGLLVVLKVTALVGLGVLGRRQRRSALPVLADRDRTEQERGRAFTRLAGVEVLVMGAAFGIAGALSRSAPPVPDTPATDASAVLSLTGYAAPSSPLEGGAWFTGWRVDWLWLSLAVLAVSVYLAWTARLHRRADRWPVARTIWWVAGWLTFVYLTSGPPGVYGRLQFSVHMVMHMGLSMVVPILLVLAAPVTLAVRALPARKDKTLGPRELVLTFVHSRVLRVLGNPVVAAALFFASLVTFYYSGLFGLALMTHTGHVLMVFHFLLSGYLFAWVLIGVDPGPPKWPAPMRLLVLFATISLHAFFGVALTSQTTLLAPGYYPVLGLPWPVDPVADQQLGGAIAWGVGEVPTLMLAILVTLAWLRQDNAETRRTDRQADRDGGAELQAYNEMLAARAAATAATQQRADERAARREGRR